MIDYDDGYEDDFDEDKVRQLYRNAEPLDVAFDGWRGGVSGRRFIVMPFIEREANVDYRSTAVAYRSAAPGESDVVCLSSAALQTESGVARLIEALRAAWSPENKASVGLGSVDLAVDVIRAAHATIRVDCDDYIRMKREQMGEATSLLAAHREEHKALAAKSEAVRELPAKGEG